MNSADIIELLIMPLWKFNESGVNDEDKDRGKSVGSGHSCIPHGFVFTMDLDSPCVGSLVESLTTFLSFDCRSFIKLLRC